MVDDRRASILQAVVQQYIATSQPVSSAHVADAAAIPASSATIRNEMAALEREGFLRQPHTSAGRVPTDQGYRFFVDHLDGPAALGPQQQQDVRAFFDRASGEIEQMLHETGRLLTHLTGAAAVVVAPPANAATIRSVQLVSLGVHSLVAVVVFSNGDVDKCTLDTGFDTGFSGSNDTTQAQAQADDAIAKASSSLNHQLAGRLLKTGLTTKKSGDLLVDQLAQRVLDAFTNDPDADAREHVYVGGAARLAEAFDAVDTVRNVLTILEQQFVVVTLLRDLLERDVTVSIGAENGLQPLADCSIVVAPTIIDGEQRGSVAVLGPTRMDYSATMAAVAVVGRRLGERLTETDG